jgi:S1-C subfamily serine protease
VALVALATAGGIALGVRLAGDDRQDVATPTSSTETTSTTDAVALVLTAEELVARFGDAVWRVETYGCDEIWTGTAFAIDDHHLITNHHVVANSTRPVLEGRDGSLVEGTVIGWAERPDVAVIRVEVPLDLWLDWAPTDDLREGQSLVALGYPVPDTVFTATPGSIMSFQARTGVREAVRTNAALDRGNSGGPALDSQGRVIGVVTEMAPNLGGFQLVPLVFTHAALADLIDGILAAPGEPDVECPDSGWLDGSGPEPAEPDTWSSGAETYGDSPTLDALWDLCEGGDVQSCDDLWWMSPEGSDYERFGDTCGDRNRPAGWCTDIYGDG